jgi:undecaprenyl-diphosphatase
MTHDELRDLPRRVARRGPLVAASAAFVLVALLALVIFYREANKPFAFEAAWMGEVLEHRTEPWTSIALFFDIAGGGIVAVVVVPAVVITGLLLYRRPWGALYYATATLACVVVVQTLKQVVGRPRPVDILVQADVGSFPSGHSANAAVMATTLAVLLPRLWVLAVGAAYTAAMMFTRTYLGAHWISDTLGGLLVGAGVAVVVWALLARRLADEQDRPRGSVRT